MVEMYEKGQIVIPKHIRDILGWHKGSNVNVRLEDRRVILEPSEDGIEEMRRLRAELTKDRRPTDELIAIAEKKRNEDWSRVP